MEVSNNVLVFMVQKLIKTDLYQIGHCVYCMYLNNEVPSFSGFKSINYFEMHANYFQNAEVLKGQEYYSELLRSRRTERTSGFPVIGTTSIRPSLGLRRRRVDFKLPLCSVKLT